MAPEDPDKAEYLIFPKWEPLIYDRKKKKKLNTGDYSILFQNGKWKKTYLQYLFSIWPSLLEMETATNI